jgi:hypothetical protein
VRRLFSRARRSRAFEVVFTVAVALGYVVAFVVITGLFVRHRDLASTPSALATTTWVRRWAAS